MHGDEVYRLTQRDNGWVWCDLYGKKGVGGDNIALVQEIEGIKGYAEAVYKLIAARSNSAPVAAPTPRTPPTLPVAGYKSKSAGRAYLERRGIEPSVIEAAEQAGFLHFAPGSVLFVGYDAQGGVQAATRRSTAPDDDVQRRDLRGTDKRFPPILHGDPGRVWIVEGGIDALALYTMYRRRGEPVPTVIVSGGAGVRSFLEREAIQQMLRGAARVTVAYEKEKDAETQERTDSQHDAQCQRVAEITGQAPEVWKPRDAKDLADHNVRQRNSAEVVQQEENLGPNFSA